MSARAQLARTHLIAPVPTAALTERADTVRVRISDGTFESIDKIWVIDDGHLVGIVPIGILLRAASDDTVASMVIAAPASVEADLDHKRLAIHAIAQDLDAIPIVHEGRFAGVIPARTLLRVLHSGHTADLHRLVGIAPVADDRDSSPYTLDARNALHRLPWLVIGLGGSLVASGIMGRFEETLRRDMAVAYFVPAIVYIADAVGTQTEALMVRSLALGNASGTRFVLRELGTGAILGLILGIIAAPAVGLLWGNTMLGIAVGLSVLVASGLASSIGMALPWALAVIGTDPAHGSGPLATIIQDVLSIVVYLAMVNVLMG